ncbi:MAG TPA: type II secretion system protein GspC [Gammaproteobacteria bacterium]|jgi:general secretion pathway protein C|nr:type II secretion system protein GspC [Gammaproteobacteria bacterium]
MDLAKHLGHWKEQTPEQWLRAANRYLPPAVTAILVLAIAYQLAALTWVVAPGAAPLAVPAARAAASAPGPSGPAAADLEAVAAMHLLFGEPAKETAPVAAPVTDAPDTTLSLDLKGILAFAENDPNGGKAIISANRGEDKTYNVGQTIDAGSGTTLHSVFEDRVLLDRGDRLETLRLPKEVQSAAGAPRARSPVMAPPAAAPPPGNETLRNVISQNAGRLTDIIRIAPNVEQGKVTGFRVQPGRDRATFDALGLMPGDVVTDINGVVLDDANKGLQAFEALGEATMANVTVLREGTPQALVIDTTQLQGIRENRQ